MSDILGESIHQAAHSQDGYKRAAERADQAEARVEELEARIAHLEADLQHQTALARRWQEKWERCHALAWSLQRALRAKTRKGKLDGILDEQELALYREVFPGHGE
jgi:type II secretory pathway component PulJ